MSDTTTLTPDERAEWRERLTSKFSCFDAELGGFTLRLLNALEVTEGMLDGSVQETRANFSAVYQACTEIIPDLKAKLAESEARAENAEKELAGADAEIAGMRDELEDSRGTEKDAPNVLCAIARLVGVYEHCQEIGDDMGEMTLDAVRDLLADKQTAEANVARLTKERDWLANQLYCPPEFTNCALDCAECWKEAARRAVAAGEE